MKNILILLLTLALLAGAVFYRFGTPDQWRWERLPMVGPWIVGTTDGMAPIVGPAEGVTQLAPGEPLDNAGTTEIDVVAMPATDLTETGEATPVTSSAETLPTASEIAVVLPSVTEVVTEVPASAELVVPTVSPAAELAGQLALLISAVQADVPEVPQLAAHVKARAEAAGDGTLASLVEVFTQPAPVAPVVEENWLDRWVKIRKKDAVTAVPTRQEQLQALVSHYVRHYAAANPATVPAKGL